VDDLEAVDLGAIAVGDRRRLGLAVVVGVAVLAGLWLVALRSVGPTLSAGTRDGVFLALFGPVPAAAGGVCGHRYCGFPAAVAAGLAPGSVLAVLVTVAGPYDVVVFAGGATAATVAVSLAGIGFVWSTTGFGVGVVVSVWRDLG
jgi:hypothetical protein